MNMKEASDKPKKEKIKQNEKDWNWTR